MSELENLLESIRNSILDNPAGEPYCSACWWGEEDAAVPLELDENGNLSCPNCNLAIEVKGIK